VNPLSNADYTIYLTFFTFTYHSCWVSSVNGFVSAGGSFSRHLYVIKVGNFCMTVPQPVIWGYVPMSHSVDTPLSTPIIPSCTTASDLKMCPTPEID